MPVSERLLTARSVGNDGGGAGSPLLAPPSLGSSFFVLLLTARGFRFGGRSPGSIGFCNTCGNYQWGGGGDVMWRHAIIIMRFETAYVITVILHCCMGNNYLVWYEPLLKGLYFDLIYCGSVAHPEHFERLRQDELTRLNCHAWCPASLTASVAKLPPLDCFNLLYPAPERALQNTKGFYNPD